MLASPSRVFAKKSRPEPLAKANSPSAMGLIPGCRPAGRNSKVPHRLVSVGVRTGYPYSLAWANRWKCLGSRPMPGVERSRFRNQAGGSPVTPPPATVV